MPMNPSARSRFVQSVKQRLSPQFRTNPGSPQNSELDPIRDQMMVRFVSHGPFGIVDLGASQTITGDHQVQECLLICQKTSVQPP